jgi:uncharacterized protein YjiS (DUF1127 family)
MDTTYFLPRTHQTRLRGWPMRALAWLGACLERSRQRHHLAGLTDELLGDIGLSRTEVARECGRWPWDGPPLGRPGAPGPGIRRASAR